MASNEGSRKRLKISRTESKATSSNMASTSIPVGCNGASGSACGHEQSLKALQTDIDSMRQIVTCKICHRLLYEPYSLACGHTYCYSCLSQWLVDSRKKTCPDCRAVVNQEPTPSYLVRELVLVFVSRNELLPDGETKEEHQNFVKEEAEVIAKDKANTDPRTGGLFKGCFKRGAGGWIGPMRDAADGVDRCPHCHWELEEGYCNQCGEVIDPHEHLGFSDYDEDSDITDDELDHELDAEDAAAVFGADGQDDYDNESNPDYMAFQHFSPDHSPDTAFPAEVRQGRRIHPAWGFGQSRFSRQNLISSDEEESDDNDDEQEMNGFVVDDNNVEYEESDEGEETDPPATSQSRYYARRRQPNVVASDDDQQTNASTAGTSAISGSEDDDSEDEEPVSSQRRKRGILTGRLQRGRRAVSSEDENSLNEGDDEDQDNAVENYGGFSPLSGSSAITGESAILRGHYDSESGDTVGRVSYDSDGVSTSTIHPVDNEDIYGGPMYHDEDDHDHDDSDDDDDSDESESDDGWDTETPTNAHSPPPTSSHRLEPLARRRGRCTNSLNNASRAIQSPSMTGRSAYPFEAYSTLPNYRTRENAAPLAYGMFRGTQQTTQIPSHPFQLGNTLNHVNSRTTPHGRTYNQRGQQVRSNPLQRTVSATSSRGSTGGVDLRESNSNGSGATVRPAASGRRKRLLSISSDDSVEDVRRSYEY